MNTLRTHRGAALAALIVMAAIVPAALVPTALAHRSSCTLTTHYGGFQECTFSCEAGDYITITISPQQHDSAIGGTATCGGATATCSAPGGGTCTAVSSTPASYHDDSGSCNNQGPLGGYAETIQTCSSVDGPDFSLGDDDGDLYPNAVEQLICGTALAREAVAATSVIGHECVTSYDYNYNGGGDILVDRDGDLLPDDLEPVLCLVENQNLPQDGWCDSSRQDYTRPPL